MSMFGMKAGPALAAGNCIILKSSEKSPLSASFAASLGAQAGIPPGVLQVVTGAGLTGKLLAEYVSTGSSGFTMSRLTNEMRYWCQTYADSQGIFYWIRAYWSSRATKCRAIQSQRCQLGARRQVPFNSLRRC